MLLGSSNLGRRAGTPVWRRQLGRSLRPSLMWVGAFTAAVLLGIAVAAGPLMLASVANAAFDDEYRSYRSPEDVGLNFAVLGYLNPGLLGEFLQQVRGAAAEDLIAPPVTTVSDPEFSVAATRGETGFPAQLFARDGAVEHLPGRSGGGDGWWIAESMAAELGVEPGDTLWLEAFDSSFFAVRDAGNAAAIRVAGTYRDLHEVVDTTYWTPEDPLAVGSAMAEYWAPFAGRVVRPTPLGVEVRPWMIVGEPDTVAAADWGSDVPLAQVTVAFPPDISGARLDEARGSLDALADLRATLTTPESDVGRLLQSFELNFATRHAFISLGDVIGHADETSTLVGSSTRPLITAIQVVALLVVVSAGVYLARLRAGELRLLRSQGLGPRVLAAYTVIEMLLPSLLGAAAGWGLAVLLVGWLGPAPDDSPQLLRATALTALAVVLAGLLLMWLVTIGLMWGAEREAHPLRRANRWRWEVPVLALAAVAAYQAATRGTAIIPGPDGPEVDAFIIAFPLLALVAAAALVVRLGQVVLPRLRARGRPTRRARFLAAQRLSAAGVPALVYVASSVAALGALVYGLSAQQSLDRTIDAKITSIVGADVAVDVPSDVGGIESEAFASTTVYRTAAAFSDGARVEVLAIDPATFAEVAGSGAAGQTPAQDRLGELAQDRGGPIAALLVNGSRSGVVPLSPRGAGSWEIEAEILGRVSAFPGASSRDPALVVAADRFVEAITAAQGSSVDPLLLLRRDQEVWFHGDEEQILAHLSAFDIPHELILTAAALRRDPSVAAVAWTVDILFVIGLGGAVLALVGAGVYLYTRQDARLFSYLLLRKMGLSRGRHLAALVLEVGSVLGVGLLAGAAVGAGTARFMALRLDPMPDAPGLPQFSVPYARIGLVVLACALGCVAAGWLVQRASDRARAAELLRQGDLA